MKQLKTIPIMRYKLGTSRKAYLIGLIIRYSKIAHDMFNTEILTLDELNKMPVDQLVNVHAELRIRIGIKRTPYQYQQT